MATATRTEESSRFGLARASRFFVHFPAQHFIENMKSTEVMYINSFDKDIKSHSSGRPVPCSNHVPTHQENSSFYNLKFYIAVVLILSSSRVAILVTRKLGVKK